ncbi:LacI family DNA-binding transcriptional regulator [Clostridium oryzae]|uniref:Ribose operon repressor n=1 Tax=Clostridium oryzae TaxID=1450648 RepID=A0A1V4IJL3_9CLOT|nr:LacI family DNA-binding transcriptional regulator [Clostridium oryzae]OPJ60030.1 ribose operon repressor [Clostridium oryzae]
MNTKKVTIKDVAKEAGVSIATVSYVINKIDKVADDKIRRVNEAIEKLKYEPNLAARSLVKREARIIAVITSAEDRISLLTANPFFHEFINGVEFRCRKSGYSTLIMGINDNEKFTSIIKGGNISGVIVTGYISKDKIKMLNDVTFPTLMLDQEKDSDNFIYLNTQDEKGAFLATEYLIKKGHKNIGLLTGQLWESPVYRSRFDGYRAALEKNGIKFIEDYVFQTQISYEGGVDIAKQVIPSIGKMTSLFCASDIVAIGLIKELYHHNVYVPKDLSVIGFDNIQNSKYFIPELTTISQNIFEKGEKAAELIISKLDNTYKSTDNEFIIPVSLVERESVLNL